MKLKTTVMKLNKQLKHILAISGFNIHELASNSRKLMNAVNKEELADSCQQINLASDVLPKEKILGLIWDIETVEISISVDIPTKEVTKRNILSAMYSIYDPMGFI